MAGASRSILVPEDIIPIKIVFLGDRGIGKTTFIETYCYHISRHYRMERWRGIYLAYRQYRFVQVLCGRIIDIQLLDLPAGLTVESRSGQWPYQADVIVLCFAVDEPNSLRNVVDRWLPEVVENFVELPRIHLLGLRNDLRENVQRNMELERDGLHPVTLLEALVIYQSNWFSRKYMECSARQDPIYAIYVMGTLITHISLYRLEQIPD